MLFIGELKGEQQMSEYVLEARGIVKTFPGVKALSQVDFGIQKGEIRALVGENGAGKSTLMMVLGGIYQPDQGEIFVEGKKVRMSCAHDSIKSGIGIVFQELSLVQQLSVAENIFFNRQPVRALGFIDKKKMYQETKKLLAEFDIEDIDPNTLVSHLSIAKQQVVEILKAMSENPKVIVLDEPTSSLTDLEVEQLFRNINHLKAQGTSFIYISHHLPEIFKIADTVTILRDGEKVASANVSEIDEDYLITNMVGRSIENIYGCRTADEPIGSVMFEAKNLTRKGYFEDISFTVSRGEIVGFSGLVGAGRTEVGRAIFGADPLDHGSMMLDGKEVTTHSPEDAIEKGIAYMTEDRKSLGLYLDFDILQNLAANKLKTFTKHGLLQDNAMRDAGEKCVADYAVATPSLKQKIMNLSGGNQQKVMLAQWISTNPKLLIVDEPTRGVDVGAKCEIYQILRKMAKEKQCAILVISSDLSEILGISDRIYVMQEGRMAGEICGEDANEEAVIRLAAGSKSNKAI